MEPNRPGLTRSTPRDEVARRLRHIDRNVLVLSGMGGVGSNTVAVNLAAAIASCGRSVGLVELTDEPESCRCFPGLSAIAASWRAPSAHRATVVVVVALFALALVAGAIGPPGWGWKRVTFLLVSLFALFVVATVPEHFLEEHLWQHVVRSHVPRVFSWTLGAMVTLVAVGAYVDVPSVVAANRWAVLALALLLGIVPESGPHLVFVTLYAAGTLPLGVLVASSAAQDGHGMLPLLAHSRRDFLRVKAVNVAVGAVLGAALLAAGV